MFTDESTGKTSKSKRKMKRRRKRDVRRRRRTSFHDESVGENK
jgi:hypothetical protein